MVECSLSFSFTGVFPLASFGSVLVATFHFVQWFALHNHFSWTERSLWLAKGPDNGCSAFCLQTWDVKRCHPPWVESQPLYARGKGAEMEGCFLVAGFWYFGRF